MSPLEAGAATPPRKPIAIFACRVLQDMLERLLPASLAPQLRLMDYGLHRVPVKLTVALQEALSGVTAPSLVVLGYGLCGNGLSGLQAGPHTLLVPRTDDCIALLLGSYRAYMREFQAVPGTYYLTKGWLESGSNPLQEYQEYVPKYGETEAMWLMDQQYQNYERVALVAHTQADLDQYRSQAQAVAKFCERWGMRYEEILGADTYARRLIEAAGALAAGQALPDGLSRDFVVIPPGNEIRPHLFMR
jgi:Protein of unknown function (DUF1638)